MRRDQRGSSLLVALVVVAVLAILGTAAVVFTGQEMASARQYQKREALASCSTAARNWMMAQFRPGAQNARDIVNFAGSIDTGRFLLHTGHLGSGADGGFQPGVKVVEGGNASVGAVDLTNTTGRQMGRLGGKTYMVVVSCQDKETDIATEVELEVRLAL